MRRLSIAVVVLVWLAAGCAAGNVRPGSGRTLVVQGRTYDQVWAAVTRVAFQKLTAIVESDRARGRLVAEHKSGFATWGELVGIFITPANVASRQYTVEVVSRKRSGMQLTGQDWEPIVIDALRADLGV
jgi:hypothetical protein